MKQKLFLLIFLLFLALYPNFSQGQNCYQPFLEKGINAYDNLDFETAINQFKAAKICDDLPNGNEVDDWIFKAQNGFIDAIKKERSKAQSLALTAKSILELQSKNNSTKAFRYAQYALQMDDTPESRAALYESFYQLENTKRKLFYIKDATVYRELENAVKTAGFIDNGQTIFVKSKSLDELLLYDFNGNKIAQKNAETISYSRHAYAKKTGLLLTTEKAGDQHYVLGFYLKDAKISDAPHFRYLSPGGKVYAFAVSNDGQYIIAAFYNGEVHVLNSEGKFIYSIKNERPVVDVVFSEDDHVALVSDKDLKVLKLATTNYTTLMEKVVRHYDEVKVAISPVAKYVMTGYSRRATVWDVKGDSLLATYKDLNVQLEIGNFSFDEKYVTFGHQILNLETKKVVNEFHEEVRNMKFSPDRRFLLANTFGNTLRIWMDRGAHRDVDYDELGGHKNFILKTDFSPDSTHILTTSADQTFKIWNIGMGAATKIWSEKELHTGINVESELAVVATGRNYWENKKNELKFFKANGEILASYKLPVENIMALSTDAKYIFANVGNGVEVWAMDLANNSLKFSVGYSGVDTACIVDFSTNEKVVYFSNQNYTYSLKTWDLKSNKMNSLGGYNELLSSVKWSPDNKHIAALGNYGTLYIWNVEKEPVMIKSWKPHPEYNCNKINFSQDGQKIITCGKDNIPIIWDVEGHLLTRLVGHTNKVSYGDMYEINDASFSSDGRYIISASKDGTVIIWSADGELIYSFESYYYGAVQAMFSQDNRYILTRYNDGTFKIWPFDPLLIFKYMESFDLPDLSDSEKRKYGIVEEERNRE